MSGEEGRVQNEAPDRFDRDALETILEELREVVRQYNGSIPNPRDMPDFYAKIDAIVNDPMINITLKEVAERIGVSYSLLRKRMQQYRKMMEKGEIVPMAPMVVERPPPPGEEGEQQGPQTVGEERVLSPSMERIALRYILKHFGKQADVLAKHYIEDVVRTGLFFVEAFGSWCRENGFSRYEDCLRNAMNFFIAYRDKVLSLERELAAWKSLAVALLHLASDNLTRLAALDIVRAMIVDVAERGRTDLIPYITEIAQTILEQVMRVA